MLLAFDRNSLTRCSIKIGICILEMLFHLTLLNSLEEEGNIIGLIFKTLKSEHDFLVSDRDRMKKKKARRALN